MMLWFWPAGQSRNHYILCFHFVKQPQFVIQLQFVIQPKRQKTASTLDFLTGIEAVLLWGIQILRKVSSPGIRPRPEPQSQDTWIVPMSSTQRTVP